jgi:phosphoadenosine phosphosulfate reductase
MDRIDAVTLQEAVEAARGQGIDSEPRRLLLWAHALLGERLMMSTAFGKSGMVILHLVKDILPRLPVYFLDTGFHFRETLGFVEELRAKWGLNLILQRPRLYGPSFIAAFGEKLYETDPDLCCHKNKVEPFRELFGEEGRYQGWITGVRRDQASTRAQAEPIELLEGGLVKVQPLALWTREAVEGYLRLHRIELHPLFGQGYTSIGCEPCTRPCADAQNERAGRWAGTGKTECGLHTRWKKAAEQGAAPAAASQPAGATGA